MSTMDPDGNIREQREQAVTIMSIRSMIAADDMTGDLLPRHVERLAYASFRLATLVLELDRWIRVSGNPPREWTRQHSLWNRDGTMNP